MADDAAQEGGLGELVEVDVGDLRDAEAGEGGWEVVDGEGAGEDAEFVAGDLGGVEGEADRGGGAEEEVAPGEEMGALRCYP